MGQEVNEKELFRIEDKLEKKSEKYKTRHGKSPFSLLNNILKK